MFTGRPTVTAGEMIRMFRDLSLLCGPKLSPKAGQAQRPGVLVLLDQCENMEAHFPLPGLGS